MTRIESPGVDKVTSEPVGLVAWIKAFLTKVFGLAGLPDNVPSARATDVGPDDATSEEFVLAPCGYRIRVPHPSDVGHSVGEMMPQVKEGLSLLPPLPTVVGELLREIQDPNSTASSVAEVAASDPALAASLLRTANSASMGLSRAVTSVSEAVSYLGFGTVKAMVIRLRLEEVMSCKDEKSARDSEDLWVHSLVVSYAAECLAKRVGGVDHGFVATLGLLHDIGKMAVLAQLPREAESLWNSAGDGSESTLAREARVLGLDHAGLGANLAAKWKLPADLVQAIRWHHKPASAFSVADPVSLRKSLHIVQIANQLAKYCFPHSDRMEIDQIPDEVYSLLKLDPSLPKLLTAEVRRAIANAILFATSNTRRPSCAPRRFLRPVNKEQAMRLLAEPVVGTPQITADDALAATLLVSGGREFPIGGEKFPDATGVAHARFTTSATSSGIEKCIKAAEKHQEAFEVEFNFRGMAVLTIKSLLANWLPLATKEEKFELVQLVEGRRLTIAFRAACLNTERRTGTKPTLDAAARLAELDLATLLNLGWFEKISVSSDGSTLILVGK